MTIDKIILSLAVVVCLAAAAAAAPALVEIDQWGQVEAYWLEPSSGETITIELKHSLSGSSIDQASYSYDGSPESFDIAKTGQQAYLVYAMGERPGIFLSSSIDSGRSFASSSLISDTGRAPAVAARNDRIVIAWQNGQEIYLKASEDRGNTYQKTLTVSLTDESLSCPDLQIDTDGQVHLCFISSSKLNPIQQIRHLVWQPEDNTGTITRSAASVMAAQDEIAGLQLRQPEDGSLLVLWHHEYNGRFTPYYSTSPDNGRHFSQVRPLAIDAQVFDLGPKDGRWYAATFSNKAELSELFLPELAAPVLDGPSLSCALPVDRPLLCEFDLATNSSFSGSVQTLTAVATAGAGMALSLSMPDDLPEGTYFIRVRLSDGLRQSPNSQAISRTVDTTAPCLISWEAERVINRARLSGRLDEAPVLLELNGTPLSCEADHSFSCEMPLEAGSNFFTLLASDEAGNYSLTTNEVYYHAASPEIQVISPADGSWLGAGSAIVIEANVFDLQNDLTDGQDAELKLNGKAIDSMMAYDAENNGLYGFIQLPEELSEGSHDLIIELTDQAGNKGQASQTLNIDRSPPQLQLAAGEKCHTSQANKISLPLSDSGAGLDLAGTLIQIDGVTIESGISHESDRLIVSGLGLMLEGTHEVKLAPRDLVGNTGEVAIFTLVYDHTPPILNLSSSCEPHVHEQRLVIEGTVDDLYPDSITIYLNNKQVKNFALSGHYFSTDVELVSGNNEIRLEAADEAGNLAASTLRTFLAAADTSGLIGSFIHGPNPFSPRQQLAGAFSTHGKGMIFAYSLVQPADVTIRVYDITGTLIWISRQSGVSGSQVTAWNGVDQFGQMVGNGIYPFFFSAEGGSRTEMRRGKIVVCQ